MHGPRTTLDRTANRRARLDARPAALALLAGALFFGGLLRLGAARAGEGAEWFWTLDWEYYGIGAQLADQGRFRPYPGWLPTAVRMPLYPAALSVVRRSSPGMASVRAFQAVLDWGAILAVYACAALLGGGLAGGIAAALYALHGPALAQVPVPQIECFFGALVTLALLAWVRAARAGVAKGSRAAAAGALGLTLACRSTFFLFAPFLALAFPARNNRARLGMAAALLLGGFLFLAPWTLRNAVLFRSFIPLENGAAAFNLWGASTGMLEGPTVPKMLASPQHRDFIASVQRAPDLERRRLFWAEAARNIRRSPLRFIGGFFRRLPVLWKEQWLNLLLAAGIFLRRRLPDGALVVLAVIAYFNIHAFMGVTSRYAGPASGALAVAAGLGAQSLLARLAGRRLEPEPFRWPGRLASAAWWAFAAVFLVAAAQSTAEALRGRRDALVPPEYAADPGRYASLKAANAAGVDLVFEGRPREAASIFDALLRADPGSGELLINRASARSLTGDRNGAAADFRAALGRLEFPGGRPSRGELERRLSQF